MTLVLETAAPRLHIIPGSDRLYAIAFATPSPEGWLIIGEREAEFDRWEHALAAKQAAEAASLNIMEKRS